MLMIICYWNVKWNFKHKPWPLSIIKFSMAFFATCILSKFNFKKITSSLLTMKFTNSSFARIQLLFRIAGIVTGLNIVPLKLFASEELGTSNHIVDISCFPLREHPLIQQAHRVCQMGWDCFLASILLNRLHAPNPEIHCSVSPWAIPRGYS